MNRFLVLASLVFASCLTPVDGKNSCATATDCLNGYVCGPELTCVLATGDAGNAGDAGSVGDAGSATDAGGSSDAAVADAGSSGTKVDAGTPNTLAVDKTWLGFGTEFGSQTTVNGRTVASIALINTGAASLTINGVSVSGSDASAFVATLSTGLVLAMGEQAWVRVTFTPTVAREYRATLTVTSSSAQGPVDISLSGQGKMNDFECLGAICGYTIETRPIDAGAVAATWPRYTQDGRTLLYQRDSDGDDISDDLDNCPFASNRDQVDGDGDKVGNSCDNCAAASNANQLDLDGDGQGNLCDSDLDGDTIANAFDSCPNLPNANQADLDVDTIGDRCDPDADGDGFANAIDLCPGLNHTPNEIVISPGCNPDSDDDGIGDFIDNCLAVKNVAQADLDHDGLGDLCDLDIDDDGVLNLADNCAIAPNRNQHDDDHDGIGDACDVRYCVVTDYSNLTGCLDPAAVFAISAGGMTVISKGETLRLPLYANRNGRAMRYIWAVTNTSTGFEMTNQLGYVTTSRAWEYVYQDGAVPTFKASVSGSYTLQVTGELMFPDQYPQTTAVATFNVVVP